MHDFVTEQLNSLLLFDKDEKAKYLYILLECVYCVKSC